MQNIKSKYSLPTRNGKLTDVDFDGEAPPIGSADQRYSDADLAAWSELADELKQKAKQK